MSATGKSIYVPGIALLRDEVVTQPISWYRTMRTTQPLYYNPEYDLWEVFTYPEVQKVLTACSDFSSEFIPANAALRPSIVRLDPPRHRQIRNLVAQAFTCRSISRLTPRIAKIVHGLLNQAASNGAMDIVNDLAHPLPIYVIAELLGVPAEDHERFKRWSNEVVACSDEMETRPHEAMDQYFCEMLEQRKKDPRDDLISELLAASIGGEKLTHDQLLAFCTILLIAGNLTTTHLISNAMLCFEQHPEVVEQLRNNPALIPDAVEEVLRYRSPIRLITRLATRDTVLLGQQIKAGQMVVAWLASANLDEQQFPHADQFDITRSSHDHIAFGYGVHFCLGAPLARLEAKIALESMFARFPVIRRIPHIPVEPIPSLMLNGVRQLPVTFLA